MSWGKEITPNEDDWVGELIDAELKKRNDNIDQLEAELLTASIMLLDLAVDEPEELNDARINIDGWNKDAVMKIRQKIRDITKEGNADSEALT